MHLLSLVYTSLAAYSMREDDLTTMLAQARANNLRRHVTGMLLYQDGVFMQAIEGPAKTILALEQIIRADPRHTDMRRLLLEPVAERQFPSWAMGFRKFRPLERRFGETDFLHRSLDDVAFVQHPTEAQQLLLGFREAAAVA